MCAASVAWTSFCAWPSPNSPTGSSLRDIEACLGAQPAKLYHLGIRGKVTRSNLADANEGRDWRIHCEFAQALIQIARRLYTDEPLSVELDSTVYALDSTTIDLCLTLFPWAPFRETKAAVKLHMLLDLRGAIPTFIHISDGKLHDVNVLDILTPEPGAFYVMDRGYLDFEWLYVLHQAGAFFVTRAKSNLKCRRIYSHAVDRSTGIICDQTIELTVFYSQRGYPERLRRVRYKDPENGKTLVLLTNHFGISTETVCALYKSRWQVELFFKWIKQHLRIKRFFGTSENAVKSQNDAIKLYAKLPGWFKVPTPLASYNPDWAILVEQDGAQRLYFVVETKSSLFTDDLRDKETAKIECSKAHFKALAVGEAAAQYVVARSVDDLLTRANGATG